MKRILLFALILLSCSMYGQTIRILPLGNSITQADNIHYSYRFRLWEKLRDAGVDFNFVGTMNSNYGGNPTFPDAAFDKDHEGHRGWRADQLLGGLPTWLQTYTPDVVLVHAGTNDVFMGNTIASTVEEIKGIIDALRADNPDVSILLAKIIGTTAPENTRIIELNSKMDGIAALKSTSRSIVKVVDQYSGFNPATDAYDGKHPNAAGEEKMAEKWFQALMTIIEVPPSTGSGSGLSGEYFNNKDLSGASSLNRIDPQVNFDWRTGSPGVGVNVDYFSIRWTGNFVAPVSGNYTFSTISDDGVRLWVNDVLVINNWTYHSPTTNNSNLIALTGGNQYSIRMEYFENGSGAVAKLLWTYPGQTQQPIPQRNLYPGAAAEDNQPPSVPVGLTSANVTETSFTLSWAASTDNNSVTGYEVFRNGTSLGAVSGRSKLVNGLSAGTVYSMTVRARDAAGNWSQQSSALKVTTVTAQGENGGTGLNAAYYNTKDFTGPIILSRLDPQVNFNWGSASPGTGMNENYFSVRWTGWVEAPVSASYIFSTVSDDGVRLWVNDVLVINNWTNHSPTTNNSASVSLTGGARYSLRMEYFENGGGAVAKLLWTYSGQQQQPIPPNNLYRSDQADVQAPSAPTGLSASGITETSFVLSWNAAAASEGVTGYEVFRDGNSIGVVSGTSKNITGLSPGSEYAMSVKARDAAGNWSQATNALKVVTTAQQSEENSGNGLNADYYNSLDLSGPVVLNRIDPSVNFDWMYASPGTGVSNNLYSTRWTGLVQAPVTGNYTFSTVSDDGVRLWVDGILVIGNWSNHKATTNNSALVPLTAGHYYEIRMEYYESGGSAVAKLLWMYPGQTQQPVPQARLYTSVPGADASASSVMTEDSNTSLVSSSAGAEAAQIYSEDVFIYPNPATSDNFQIAIYAERETESQITITSADKNVKTQIFKTLIKGNNLLEIPIGKLNSGVYVVTISDGPVRIMKKLFIRK